MKFFNWKGNQKLCCLDRDCNEPIVGIVLGVEFGFGDGAYDQFCCAGHMRARGQVRNIVEYDAMEYEEIYELVRIRK